MMRVLLALLLLTTSAQAHKWYDFACCSENDCEEVQGFVKADESGFTLPNGIFIPRGDSRIRKSLDYQYHWCLYPGNNGSLNLRCLYVPEGGGS